MPLLLIALLYLLGLWSEAVDALLFRAPTFLRVLHPGVPDLRRCSTVACLTGPLLLPHSR